MSQYDLFGQPIRSEIERRQRRAIAAASKPSPIGTWHLSNGHYAQQLLGAAALATWFQMEEPVCEQTSPQREDLRTADHRTKPDRKEPQNSNHYEVIKFA